MRHCGWLPATYLSQDDSMQQVVAEPSFACTVLLNSNAALLAQYSAVACTAENMDPPSIDKSYYIIQVYVMQTVDTSLS